jgi:hypothetical protein
MNSCRLRLALVTGLITSMGAQGDILNRPVSLKTEGDLIQAVSTTLQHAVATSEQYRGTEPRLQRFARKEVSARREPIAQLNKLGRIQPMPVKQLSNVLKDDAGYLSAMLRNHARLIELIEFGGGLPLSPNTRRLMDTLSRDAASEFALLSKLEKS